MLVTAVDLPATEDVERLAVHDEHARRPVGAILPGATKRAHVDAFRPAMDRVGARVAGLLEHLFRLDDLVNRGLGRIGLGVHDVYPRGTEPGDDQVSSLEERMTSERRQG